MYFDFLLPNTIMFSIYMFVHDLFPLRFFGKKICRSKFQQIIQELIFLQNVNYIWYKAGHFNFIIPFPTSQSDEQNTSAHYTSTDNYLPTNKVCVYQIQPRLVTFPKILLQLNRRYQGKAMHNAEHDILDMFQFNYICFT